MPETPEKGTLPAKSSFDNIVDKVTTSVLSEATSSFDNIVDKATTSVLDKDGNIITTVGDESPGKGNITGVSVATGQLSDNMVSSPTNNGAYISPVETFSPNNEADLGLPQLNEEDLVIAESTSGLIVTSPMASCCSPLDFISTSLVKTDKEDDVVIAPEDNEVVAPKDNEMEEVDINETDESNKPEKIPSVDTVPTGSDTNEGEENIERKLEDKKSDSDETVTAPRRRLPCRPAWLWVFACLVLALAIFIAIFVGISMTNEDSNKADSASGSLAFDSTSAPTTSGHSLSLTTAAPTIRSPSESPSVSPSESPTSTGMPSGAPSDTPSQVPTFAPSISPSSFPTFSPAPSVVPSGVPSDLPSDIPSSFPTDIPSDLPSDMPSVVPSFAPTRLPSVSPTNYPTTQPSDMPSDVPSVVPSFAPTRLPSVSPTNYPTTGTPTVSAAPTMEAHIFLIDLLNNVTDTPFEVLGDTSTPQGRALLWMATEDEIVFDLLNSAPAPIDPSAMVVVLTDAVDSNNTSNMTDLMTPPSPTSSSGGLSQEALYHLPQRYAVVVLDIALHADSDAMWSFPRLHECQWPGITCDRSEEIIAINWARQNLTGYVVPEISLLTELDRLDLAQNQLTGFVDAFWELPQLKTLYLFDNQFMGSIGTEIENMWNLESLYLGNNQLTGTIPDELLDLGDLRYLILNHNQLSGSLPRRIRMRNLFYIDLGYNALKGTLPETLIMPAVRHFDMGHNQFTGSIPQDYADLGSNRLFSFYMMDNQLTGAFPGNWHTKTPHKFLTNVDVSNNSFTNNIPESVCQLNVWNGGETVEFRADCDICRCEALCYSWCDGRNPAKIFWF